MRMRMRKRLCTTPALALSLTFTAAAVFLGPAPANALTNPRPSCSAPGARDFPVRTRIHGGPAGFDVGGGFGTWYIDLTNTTAHACAGVHPVVVLVDEKRALRPEQARLEFYADKGGGGRPHPVAFERSDEAENIGVFDDGFPGFTVGAGRTLTVKVRLSVTSDATVPNDVVANAAVVQRHGDDGDWVGESNPYRFRIENDGGDGDGVVDGPRARESTAAGTRQGSASGAGELARTGRPATMPYGLAAAAGVLAAGAALFVVSRRVRLRRR